MIGAQHILNIIAEDIMITNDNQSINYTIRTRTLVWNENTHNNTWQFEEIDDQ